MAKRRSREAQLHADWLGMLQPEGLVVSIPVLEEAAVFVRQGPEVQASFRTFTAGDQLAGTDELLAWLQWPAKFLLDDPTHTRLDLPDLGARIEGQGVLCDPKKNPLLLLAWCDGDLDDPSTDPKWPTSPQERLERLLIAKDIPVGLHVSPDLIQLVYAPSGEAPGRLSFPVAALRASDGRLLVDALQMLLGRRRLFTAPAEKRLQPLLEASRKRQDTVTVKLAGQVEDALRILLAGFDAANARSDGEVLRDVGPEALYGGLTTTLLRLVFLLYAEDRGLMPTDHPVYAQHYALGGLVEKLQHESVMFAGAMDRRFGAWARLCTLFQMVFTGARHGDLRLPPRQGDLFDPGRYPFLAGRKTSNWQQDPGVMPPVDDGVIAAVLERLLHLEGQRISYRNLEVEQIGSVYEALMGFDVGRSGGPCVPTRPHGVVVELHDVREAADPVRWLAGAIGDKPARLKKKVPELVGFEATDDIPADLDRLRGALEPLLPRGADTIPPGVHFLQPGEERRRSGSHYTPRSLTEPIVERTLQPVLDRDGPPTPERILAMKVCDPAMGSGAFLAEACRYLSRRLVEAWGRTGTTSPAALDSGDPELVARRLVAEQCLYGVDKNPRAVQLARLSLWLVTSARDLPFTFVDHALKEGDALIGLTLDQIASFSFSGDSPVPLFAGAMRGAMLSAARTRGEIVARQRSFVFGHDHKKGLLGIADDEVWDERRVGDLLIACAWAGGTKTAVRKRIKSMSGVALGWYPNEKGTAFPEQAEALVQGLDGLRPFHWFLEFPEVFTGKDPGFDCVVGNPPFGGVESTTAGHGVQYPPVVRSFWPHAHGKSDFSAFFFLRAAETLHSRGRMGLIATNSIKQGVTRKTGLAELVTRNFCIDFATTDRKWPTGAASVLVDTVVCGRQKGMTKPELNSCRVDFINSSLEAGEELPEPVPLVTNQNLSFEGMKARVTMFVFDRSEAESFIIHADFIRPFIGGDEVNNSPTHFSKRVAIDAYGVEDPATELPSDVYSALHERAVAHGLLGERKWWTFQRPRPKLRLALAARGCVTCIVNVKHSKHLMFQIVPCAWIPSHALNVFAFNDWWRFAALQSRPHCVWARQPGLASTLKGDPRYTTTTCFETFPFPRPTPAQRNDVATAGQALYEKRQQIMVQDQQGMTQVWNRLVDPDCLDPDIVELRQLRDTMDRAVLDAYGWSDLEPTDKDAILTRLRKLNAQRAAEEQQA